MAPDPGPEGAACHDDGPSFDPRNVWDVNSETRIGAENMRRLLM